MNAPPSGAAVLQGLQRSFAGRSGVWKQARRLRWPAALGALFALLGLALAGLAVPALQGEQQSLAERAQSLRSRIARSAKAASLPAAEVSPDVSPEMRAWRFRDGFPAAADRQQRVASLLNAAHAAGLAPRRAEFRYEAERASGLARYRVSLPLEGGYPALREFIQRALQQDTAMSLDTLRWRRATAQQPTLQAELVFTLHMREGAAQATALAMSTAPAPTGARP